MNYDVLLNEINTTAQIKPKTVLDRDISNKPIYITSKCRLDSIIKDKESKIIQTTLFEYVMRVHKIVIYTYQLLRLWILKQYYDGLKQENKNFTLPIISKDLIRTSLGVFAKETNYGKNKQEDTSKIYEELKKFYDEECYYNDNKGVKHNIFGNDKIDGHNLTQILTYMSTDMFKNIENNIKLNFTNYVRRFVNSCFKKDKKERLENCAPRTKTKTRNQFNKEMGEIKDDLFNNTLSSDAKYHEWINKHRSNIFPATYSDVNDCENDVTSNPQKFLKCMIYMCLEIEKHEAKSFQFFPL